MSNRGKNRHYHYAEKFEPRDRHQRGRRVVYHLPVKAVIFSLVVLLMFGLISTTFAVYVTENQTHTEEGTSPLVVSVRNLKASREVIGSGANMDLASSGWSFSGGYIYFDNTLTNWSDTYIYLVIGKSSYSSVYRMTAITNTKYYYVALPTSGWSDATYMAVIGSSTSWGSGSWGSSNLTNATHRTAAYTGGLDASANQRYIFSPATASNGCSLSLEYRGTDNDSMKIITLKAHACYSTNGTSYTADNSTGGTVKIKSYYFNSVSSVTTSETGSNASESYEAAKASANSTFTATVASGYRFVGWYTATTGGSLVSSSATYNYATTGGDKEIYARFVKRVTVTTARGSGFTGTAPTPASTTVDSGTTVTISATIPTGFTFGGWTFSGTKTFASGYSASSNPCNIIPTANVTATATYTLTAPTITTELSYSAVTLSSSSVTASPTIGASSATGSDTGLDYTYSITTASGTTATAGTDYSINASTGVVTVSKPGKYTISLSLTDTAYGVTSSATPTSTTLTVKPATPSADSIQFVVTGFTDSTTSTTGTTYSNPFKIPIDNGSPLTTNFDIRTLIPEAKRVSGYTYRWVIKAGTYSGSTKTQNTDFGTNTYGSTSVSVTDFHDAAIDGRGAAQTVGTVPNAYTGTQGSMLYVTPNGYYYYQATLYARCNGVDSSTRTVYLYYNVISNFLQVTQFNFGDTTDLFDVHRIYATGNSITSLTANYRAGGSAFDTIFYFSRDNMDYQTLNVWSNTSPLNVTQDGVTTTYTKTGSNGVTVSPGTAASGATWNTSTSLVYTFNVANYMPVSGVKYFKAYIADHNTDVAAARPTLHTTVGTSSSGGDRPIYFVDNSGNTFSDCRVMAFFADASNNFYYQTGQDITDSRTNTYRFYIPANSTKVAFAVVDKNYYILPTLSGGNITYTATNNTYYKAWTPTIDLTLTANLGKNTYKAETSSANANGVLQYSNNSSDTMTTLD